MKVTLGIDRNEGSVSLYVFNAYPYKDALKQRGYRYSDKSWYTSKKCASNEEAAAWIHDELQFLFRLVVDNWTPPTGYGAIVGFLKADDRIIKMKEHFGWHFEPPDAEGYTKTVKPSAEYLAEAEYIKEG